MKREILCEDCTRETMSDWKEGQIQPLPLPERIKKVYGVARKVFHCDLCNAVIQKGDRCTARSIVGYRQAYFTWEEDFIEVI